MSIHYIAGAHHDSQIKRPALNFEEVIVFRAKLHVVSCGVACARGGEVRPVPKRPAAAQVAEKLRPSAAGVGASVAGSATHHCRFLLTDPLSSFALCCGCSHHSEVKYTGQGHDAAF